jgi:predicted nucleotidyltransferase
MKHDNALELARRVAERLGAIKGIVAVALGGSWARGEAHPDSDIDFGLYYEPERPPSVEALRGLAQELDDRHLPDLVTDFGEWGPWINGGAWLQIEGRRVDWLYQDLGRVKQVLEDCRAGRITCDYQPGHPHGFHNYIYMGEIFYAKPLHDPKGILRELKALTVPYPPELKRAIIEKHLWEAGFALGTARKPAERGDVFYVAGCLFRCAACLAQALFALNERYFINEKGAVQAVDSFALCPEGFGETVAYVLARPGGSAAQLNTSIVRLEMLLRAVRELCAEFVRRETG